MLLSTSSKAVHSNKRKDKWIKITTSFFNRERIVVLKNCCGIKEIKHYKNKK